MYGPCENTEAIEMKDQPSSAIIGHKTKCLALDWSFFAKQILEVQLTFTRNLALTYFETTGIDMYPKKLCFRSSGLYPTMMFTYLVWYISGATQLSTSPHQCNLC